MFTWKGIWEYVGQNGHQEPGKNVPLVCPAVHSCFHAPQCLEKSYAEISQEDLEVARNVTERHYHTHYHIIGALGLSITSGLP